MRPRHKAAENGIPDPHHPVVPQASMRPRHKAAENESRRVPLLHCVEGFNEAAA